MDKQNFTKLEIKELSKLTELAYARALAKALTSLEEKFQQWRNNKITVFELGELVNKFHDGTARELWNFYTSGNADLVITLAVRDGLIQKNEISFGILGKLDGLQSTSKDMFKTSTDKPQDKVV